jgi:hypothetical protein
MYDGGQIKKTKAGYKILSDMAFIAFSFSSLFDESAFFIIIYIERRKISVYDTSTIATYKRKLLVIYPTYNNHYNI